MKKIRSFLCLAIAIMLFMTSFPVSDFAIEANAATTINYSPNPKVEYSYSTGVSAGTIRYISQINGSTYFNSIYWGSWANQAGIECGTASISMSLSYIGIDKTPKTILDVNSGITYFTGWGVDTKSYSYDNLGKSFDNYINGKGKYSPPIIHLNNYSSAGHFVVLIGRISNNQYAVLDPANATVWSITINGASAQYTHPSNARYINDSIDRSNRADDIYQYYNPNASIPSSEPATIIKTSYPSHCTIKVTENDKNIMSLPCSNKTNSKSDKVESAPKGTTYEAIGLILNTEDNLWYKVKAKNGKEGYIFAGNVSFVSAISSDITGSGISVPANHTHGKTYVLTGSVNSSYNELTNVSAYVYSGSNKITGGTASINGKSYSLSRSAIDNQTEFNKLAVGQYTYKVAASYKSYYAKTDKTYGTKTGTVNVYSQAFNVVSGSVSPTVPPQPNTIIYPNNGGIYKIAYGGGNNMYLDFSCSSNNVQIYENCDGHSDPAFVKSQYFKLTHIGDGWYTIINIGNGKCVDIENTNPASGTNIMQWDCYPNDGQLYRFYDAGNGYCYIKSKLGTYIDKKDGDTSSDTNVWSYAFNGTVAQKWKLMLIEDIISTDESKSINNKHFTNAEKLSFSGWAFSNRGKSVTFKYVLDSSSPVTVKNCYRPDVKKVYSQSCAYTDVGYDFSIDLSELSVGKHTMKIIATSFFGTELVVSNLCFYVDEHSHTYLIIGYNAASCTLDGMQTSECEICKDKKTVKINKLGHDYGDWITVKEATCTQTGIEQKTCKRCNNIQTQSIPKTGHNYVSKVTTVATCKMSGIITYTCTNDANHTYTENLGVNASNHVNTKNVAEIKATCTTKGLTAGVYCNDCQKYISGHKENAINPSNHVNTKTVPATPATFDKVGYTEGIYCNDCKKYISGHEEISFVMNIGDLDGNGKITAADARIALRASVGLENLSNEKIACADVDKNGRITAADARMILRASVGLENLGKSKKS